VDPAEENNEARPVEGRGKRQVNTRPVATATTRVDSVDENNDSRAVERKWKKDVNPRATVATTERIDPPGATNPEAVETQPPRRGSRERTSRNTTLDPFYDNSAPPPAKRETRTSKTSAAPAVPVQEPADVAAGPQKTVTVTKTVTVLPAPQTPPREHDDENGFFHRLFHPKDRSGD
jgi:hypothetical protein